MEERRLQCLIKIERKHIISAKILTSTDKINETESTFEALFVLCTQLDNHVADIDFNGDNTFKIDSIIFDMLLTYNDNIKKMCKKHNFPLTSKVNINEKEPRFDNIVYFSDDAKFLEELIKASRYVSITNFIRHFNEISSKSLLAVNNRKLKEARTEILTADTSNTKTLSSKELVKDNLKPIVKEVKSFTDSTLSPLANTDKFNENHTIEIPISYQIDSITLNLQFKQKDLNKTE